jgi:hypothetical protein
MLLSFCRRKTRDSLQRRTNDDSSDRKSVRKYPVWFHGRTWNNSVCTRHFWYCHRQCTRTISSHLTTFIYLLFPRGCTVLAVSRLPPYVRLLNHISTLVGLRGRGVRQSQSPYMLSTAQHRKTRSNIMSRLGLEPKSSVYKRSIPRPLTVRTVTVANTVSNNTISLCSYFKNRTNSTQWRSVWHDFRMALIRSREFWKQRHECLHSRVFRVASLADIFKLC